MIDKLTIYIAEDTDPYRNLAIEKFLTFHVQPSECILYLWQNRQTVVIGKNQNAWKECKVTKLESEKGHLVRRLSGGGAVFHDLGNLNFTFCVREENYSIEKQMQVILEAAKLLGIHAEKTGRNDITVEGKKFSGNAFYKSKGYCYHHGTILIDVDKSKMSEYLNVSAAKLQSKGVNSVRSRTINLKELKSDITVDEMKKALVQAFEFVYNGSACSIDAGRMDWQEIKEAEQHFSSWDWKYGRKIPFDHTIEQRFSWGEIELQFHISEGIIQDIRVFSDAMEEQLAVVLENSWEGCEYRLEKLLDRLHNAKIQSENENQIKQDLEELFIRQF